MNLLFHFTFVMGVAVRHAVWCLQSAFAAKLWAQQQVHEGMIREIGRKLEFSNLTHKTCIKRARQPRNGPAFDVKCRTEMAKPGPKMDVCGMG